MLFRSPIVLIRQAIAPYEPYDRVGDLDVTPEEFPVTATDPTFQATLTNSLTVDYDTFCPGQGHFTRFFNNNNIPAFPEDLDVAIGGTVFILTDDPNQQLTLPVRLTNNGGHDARNYNLFVSFGATMEVVSAPAGCQVVSPLSGTPPQPDPWKVWVNPPSDRKSTRLNSSHMSESRMPSSA